MSLLFGDDDKSRDHRNAIILVIVLSTFGYFALQRNKPGRPGAILQSFFRGYPSYRVRGMELWKVQPGKSNRLLSFKDHKRIKQLLETLEAGQPTRIPQRLPQHYLQLRIKENQGRTLVFRFYREPGRTTLLIGLQNRRKELRMSVGMLRSTALMSVIEGLFPKKSKEAKKSSRKAAKSQKPAPRRAQPPKTTTKPVSR
jgi:hypothetical protein